MAKEFFEDEDQDDDEQYEDDDEGPDEDYDEEDELEVKFENIDNVAQERNKIKHEMDIKVKDYKERIGRLNLDLFGDPKNPDWIAKVDELEEEIQMPLTRTHPIARKAQDVIDKVRQLQIEYMALHKFYGKVVIEIGTLLDNTISIYRKDLEELQEYMDEEARKEKLKEQKDEEDKRITKQLVEQFMLEIGHEIIDEWKNAIDAGRKMPSLNIKAKFVLKARSFFAGHHSDPKRIGNRLFAHYTREYQERVNNLYKKNKSEDSQPAPPEPAKADSKGLTDSPETPTSAQKDIPEEDIPTISSRKDEEKDMFGNGFTNGNGKHKSDKDEERRQGV